MHGKSVGLQVLAIDTRNQGVEWIMKKLDVETIEQKLLRLNSARTGMADNRNEGYFSFLVVCELLEMAITEEREACGWQPIETAPKDGETAILGYKAITGGLWVTAPMYFTEGTWRIVQFHDDNIEHSMQPSHWQHLPAAPKDEVSE